MPQTSLNIARPCLPRHVCEHMHTTGQAEQLLAAPLSEVVPLGVLDPPCNCEGPGSPARSSGKNKINIIFSEFKQAHMETNNPTSPCNRIKAICLNLHLRDQALLHLGTRDVPTCCLLSVLARPDIPLVWWTFSVLTLTIKKTCLLSVCIIHWPNMAQPLKHAETCTVSSLHTSGVWTCVYMPRESNVLDAGRFKLPCCCLLPHLQPLFLLIYDISLSRCSFSMKPNRACCFSLFDASGPTECPRTAWKRATSQSQPVSIRVFVKNC